MMQILKEKILSRRDLIKNVGILGIGGTFIGYIASTFRFFFPNVLYEPESKFSIGKPEDFPSDSITYKEEDRIFIIHDKMGLACLSSICTHLGCTVKKIEMGYECPCHGSRFDSSGKVISGPAPRPLIWYKLSFSKHGELIVDSLNVVNEKYRLMMNL